MTTVFYESLREFLVCPKNCIRKCKWKLSKYFSQKSPCKWYKLFFFISKLVYSCVVNSSAIPILKSINWCIGNHYFKSKLSTKIATNSVSPFFFKTTKPTFIVGRTWDLQGGILIQKEEMIDTEGWFIQKVPKSV